MGIMNLAGQKFGRLTVTETHERRTDPGGGTVRIFWLCACSCGEERWVVAGHLRSGHTQSCGCWPRERLRARSTTHDKTGTREHRAWKSMLARCFNPNAANYANYSARGIRVCKRWRGKQGFSNFLADMGPVPSKLTLERIDNNGNYEPGNCRWATRLEQNRNKRTNRFLTHDGRTLPLCQWVEIKGLSRSTIASRLARGWSDKEALTLPLRKRRS
ncbi:hypothetical protein LCGC14_0728060 [marine sediment metagenome]|uniref:HNH endonuclease n=1 Tax=marine sediment metagenome TaxID=412755 RepID=A0A0F9QEM1_9ZZZZ